MSAAKQTIPRHAVQYKMKCVIVEFGQECFDDCRPCEIEGAEEYFRDDFEYSKEGEIIIRFDKDIATINEKADDIVREKIIDIGRLDRMGGVVFGDDDTGEEELVVSSDNGSVGGWGEVDSSTGAVLDPWASIVVVRKRNKSSSFYSWAWDFTVEEEEFGCKLHYQGTVDIIAEE